MAVRCYLNIGETDTGNVSLLHYISTIL